MQEDGSPKFSLDFASSRLYIFPHKFFPDRRTHRRTGPGDEVARAGASKFRRQKPISLEESGFAAFSEAFTTNL